MNGGAVALLLAAGVAGVTNWWAVADPPTAFKRRIERWAKPLTMALLVAVAATAGSPGDGVRAALVVGALFGLAGDWALLGDSAARFMGGLGSFAAGHLAYAAAAAQAGFDWRYASVGLAFMLALLAFRFVTRIVPGARRQGGGVLAGAVVFYGVVIATMVVTATAVAGEGNPAWLAGVGAALFAISDWVLGHQRFAGPLAVGRLGVMVPYHLGQTFLIVGVALA